jgi:hypothetical protein
VKTAQLYRIDVASRAIAKVTPSGVFRDFDITPDGKHSAFVLLWSGALPEIATCELRDFAPRILTNGNAVLRDGLVRSREVIAWKSIDATPIEGVLIKPPRRAAQPVLESGRAGEEDDRVRRGSACARWLHTIAIARGNAAQPRQSSPPASRRSPRTSRVW